MENPGDIKIRSVPRSNEKSKPAENQVPQGAKRDPLIYLALTISLLALIGLHDFSGKPKSTKPTAAKPATGQMDLSSVAKNSSRINDTVNRHLKDADIQREIMVRNREVENDQFKNADKEPHQDYIETLPDTKDYGVRFDSDESFDRVFEDLNGDSGKENAVLPGDKINARLANRKWLNEMERAEKIQFLTAFIRSAYEHGYEVEIDSNLVVVGVKRVENRKLNINQVIDRLAKGQ